MQALPSLSNFTATNVTCSSPISTSPNHIATNSPDSPAASKSTMASSSSSSSSSLTVAEPTANKENICPLTNLAADSGVSRKRRRFVRKPLADITNQFEPRNYSNDELFRNSRSTDCQKMSKRKAGVGDSGDDGVEVRLSCRLKTKTLRMSFR
ncbi:hypothetical protein QQ045_014507 [Rhodiola kirilowii]